MKTKINIKAVMAVAPAVLREFCRTQTKGKASSVAAGMSVTAKRNTSSMANASGMLRR